MRVQKPVFGAGHGAIGETRLAPRGPAGPAGAPWTPAGLCRETRVAAHGALEGSSFLHGWNSARGHPPSPAGSIFVSRGKQINGCIRCSRRCNARLFRVRQNLMQDVFTRLNHSSHRPTGALSKHGMAYPWGCPALARLAAPSLTAAPCPAAPLAGPLKRSPGVP